MILNLHVRNLALITEADIDFREGLNILTGETGAGKSVIIGSINLALGAKADKEMIRTGAEYALIELTFLAETQEQKDYLKQMDLQMDEENCVVLQRKIMQNRSVCKICGETVTGAELKELAPVFLDMYGQHDHQTLLQTKKHLSILDSFLEEKLSGNKEKLKSKLKEYQELKNELKELSMDLSQLQRELALAEYECREIEQANLRVGEDQKLEEQSDRMQNSYKIKGNLNSVVTLLQDEDESTIQQIDRALREMTGITSYDRELVDMCDDLSTAEDLLQGFLRTAKKYLSNLDFNDEDFDRVNDRLNTINHLKSKYGQSIEKILAYGEKAADKTDKLKNHEINRDKTEQKLKALTKEMNKLCDDMTQIRKEEAQKLTEEIQNALSDLNFLSAKFEIAFEKTEGFTTDGNDKVEFLLSTNPGEPVKQLSHIASGGELSRIMLAIKTVSAKRDAVNTLIFDEIDTGISGKTAWKVAEKMGVLAKNHQIICITHLPQIAAMADTHYAIEKGIYEQSTRTSIYELSKEESNKELARMIGGDTITESAMEHAKELKELAAKTKSQR